MKILAFSDLHRDAAMADVIARQSGDFDVVVGAGDFATCGLGLQDTIAILRRMPVPFVLVPGNHDDLEELRTACADWPLANVLHGQSVLVKGVPFLELGMAAAS